MIFPQRKGRSWKQKVNALMGDVCPTAVTVAWVFVRPSAMTRPRTSSVKCHATGRRTLEVYDMFKILTVFPVFKGSTKHIFAVLQLIASTSLAAGESVRQALEAGLEYWGKRCSMLTARRPLRWTNLAFQKHPNPRAGRRRQRKGRRIKKSSVYPFSPTFKWNGA